MSDSDTSIKTDPVYRTGWNDALDWAANWITNSLGAVYGYGDETVQFTLALAMSIRAAKMSIEQQDFSTQSAMTRTWTRSAKRTGWRWNQRRGRNDERTHFNSI